MSGSAEKLATAILMQEPGDRFTGLRRLRRILMGLPVAAGKPRQRGEQSRAYVLFPSTVGVVSPVSEPRLHVEAETSMFRSFASSIQLTAYGEVAGLLHRRITIST